MSRFNLLILLAALAAAGAAPTTAPSAQEMDLLIAQLGHDDFRIREQASAKLAQIGKPAVWALKQAVKSEDPEVQSRAEMLIRRIEERPVPGGPVSRDEQVVARSLKISNDGGIKQIDVKEASRSIVIREDQAGINMTVTAVVDGKYVSETYKAKTPQELKAQSPDAFVLYERWGGSQAQMNPLVRGAENLVIRGPVFIGGLQPVPFPLDPLDELRDRVVQQMEKANVPDADRKQVADLLDKVQQGRLGRQIGVGADARLKQLKDYFESSDKLREKLEALKLADPGEDLPPPSRWRLGIQVAGGEGKLTVGSVVPDSRAEKIGLQAGDVIEKINGTAIGDINDLKAVLSKTKEPLVIVGQRGGVELKLEEKKLDEKKQQRLNFSP